mmetsp:Transcript_18205/g.32974  ORF Transcript_18205/g.32974 Transcript_18205/m.32974 type:complete len:120 (-) Transcript_18205:307-666(-)
MNSDDNPPTANEHLRSIIRDKNAFVRLGAKHGGGQLSVEKHIGVNEDCILPIEILKIPCEGGRQCGLLEEKLTQWFAKEFPGVFTNQRCGGPQYIRGAVWWWFFLFFTLERGCEKGTLL